VICFSIIDWLRPFKPGHQTGVVELENSLKGGKFSDYAGKTKLFLQCVATFGSGHVALAFDESYGRAMQFVSRTRKVSYVIDDPCSTRWYSEQGVQMNLLASTCQPFFKVRVPWNSAEGVSHKCAVELTSTSNRGVCNSRENCREGESCSFMVWGQSLGCYPIPLSGSPSIQTVVSRCAPYVYDMCEDKAMLSTDFMTHARELVNGSPLYGLG